MTYYSKAPQYLDCISEQDFKLRYVKNNFAKLEHTKTFCIETEETIAGFPDVMTLVCSNYGKLAKFYEFKFSDRFGRIKFQPTQPSFYKRNPEMEVTIIAYNKKTGVLHKFPASEIFKKESNYKIDVRAEINLCNTEVW